MLRRGCQIHYYRTKGGNEVDFHAEDAVGNTLLVQVCANAGDPATLERELRALSEAKAELPEARAQIILLDPLPAGTVIPTTIEITPAIAWFLEDRG